MAFAERVSVEAHFSDSQSAAPIDSRSCDFFEKMLSEVLGRSLEEIVVGDRVLKATALMLRGIRFAEGRLPSSLTKEGKTSAWHQGSIAKLQTQAEALGGPGHCMCW